MNTVLIAYIPVVHRGYLEFFRKYSGATLLILGRHYIQEFPRLERDTRALRPEEAQVEVQAHNIFRDVRVLDDDPCAAIGNDNPTLVLPDEDVMHVFAEKYLVDRKIVFGQTFLRWDMPRSLSQVPVLPSEQISVGEFDRDVMRHAFGIARKSSDWWRQLAACAVKDGKILVACWNEARPSEYRPYIEGDPRSNFNAGEHIDISNALHAERAVVAWAARNENESLSGADIYVTTFPCNICADLLAEAGVSSIYFVQGYSVLEAAENLARRGIKIVQVVLDSP
ncbi:MAG: hypothetical protein A2591_04175 [Candidatus Yonathbacteria bacterium RIFOXYD1_FULL_52_36]|uniref:CMP/dCMP-type deaminase domain-containing protein n=1 Tax=Candidatus Yonathbacteria bacterium RIFOXYD1_FULL_52_36 TaxID=1802730 RepID=A0A1G2SHH5_9BACT|nr:MAG: hypothetical protein A2591_04175 [Candidatus Yonathbacteria bacterium RIFOXYD1_FULL_52_36]